MTDKVPVFTEDKFNRRIKLHSDDSTSDIIKNTKFKITKSNGDVIEGVTDDDGLTPLLQLTEMDDFKMEVFHDE